MSNHPVKFDDIRMAFDFVSGGFDAAAYLCLETGKIYWESDDADIEESLPEDYDDTSKYIMLPNKYDLDLGNALVFRFTQEHLPASYDRVRDIFRRKGAYARFKDMLDAVGALDRWFDFQESEIENALRAWCAENDIAVME